MTIGTYISMITLNVNGLNAATKGHGLSEWTQKQDPYICCLQETHFRYRDTYRLEVRGQKKISMQTKIIRKSNSLTVLSDKIGLKIKNTTRDRDTT